MPSWLSPIYNTVVGLLIGALSTWVVKLINDKKQAKKKQEADAQKAEEHERILEKGVAILLRTQLFAYHTVYANRSAIPTTDWEEIEEVYAVYKELGGNHSGDRLYQELRGKRVEVVNGNN